ncbi:pre-peptidase C-terminal domain-containing protein [Ruminiclostridium cellobioparum]|uniref:pre-peptidase C-terminal domain-containing protein n=1 Tax=Ruminiclostridium cellobioparum TaxID=29355 RepID=UPI0028A7DA7D|nr:pre-peptidase C-terminal domain-containing protein [Ruminiclostridium cellobioparum]
MKKIIPFLICFSLLLSISFSSTVFAASNETEPNNTIANANSLLPGTTVNGSISTYSDVDYYQVPIMATGLRSITLSNIPSGCSYDLYLTDNKGNLITSGTVSSGSTDRIISQVLNTGTYYVYVRSGNGKYSSSNYTLSVKSIGSPVTPPPTQHGGDAYEFNDTLELASDFSTDLTYHFSIYNANGGYVCSDGGIGDYTVTLSPGTYYIKVFSNNSESVLNYRLKMTTV